MKLIRAIGTAILTISLTPCVFNAVAASADLPEIKNAEISNFPNPSGVEGLTGMHVPILSATARTNVDSSCAHSHSSGLYGWDEYELCREDDFVTSRYNVLYYGGVSVKMDGETLYKPAGSPDFCKLGSNTYSFFHFSQKASTIFDTIRRTQYQNIQWGDGPYEESRISFSPREISFSCTSCGRSTTLYDYAFYVGRKEAYDSNNYVSYTSQVATMIRNGLVNYKVEDDYDTLKFNIIGSSVMRDVILTSVIANTGSHDSFTLSSNSVIKSGSFIGYPAVRGNPIVIKGTFTDKDISYRSEFRVHPDSYKEVSETEDGIVTVVKETNPPIIIDWDDFPGIELPEMDFAAPVITVTREPASTIEATDKVTLTIKAADPNGHDDPLPISINGQDFVASPATYEVTENQAISIVAKDTFGNVREYVANVTNIDSEAPVITNVQQNSETWTNGTVKLTVTATDDVKLHKTAAYRYEFTPNSPNSTTGTTDTGWVASRFFTVPDAGTVKVTVRDSLGNESTPEVYNVVNIDKIVPTATYELATTDKVSADDGVLVSLKINDVADPVTQESSGLSVNCVKWDTNSPWESATEKVFHENGVYNVKVKDAVGNVSGEIQITVSNISTDKPVITSFTRDKTDNGYVTAPVTLTVQAAGSSGTPLHDRPYSWDGGNTWTSVNSLKVYENKEYGVMVRDAAGNTVEAYMPVLNIDSVKPTASIYMVKGAPTDDPDAEMEDWVWKLRIEADDIGSGVKAIDTLWDNQSYSSSPVVIEIAEAGIYGVTVTDNAGNQSYVEKVVTEESIGGAGGSGNGEYVDVNVPETGSAGDYFNAAVGDLVYGRTGAYNKVTKEFKTYKSGEEGITVNLVVGSKSGRYVTGTVNFNNMDYTLLFNGNEETAKGKRSIPASVFIPISGLATDINNGRIRITVKEYSDSALENHVRDGVAQLYTNVQISDPTLMYTYDSVADRLTISAVSTVAGIKGIAYDIGSGSQSYTDPVSIGSASSVTMVAEDNVGGRVEITKTAEELELNGGGGGSLPVESGDGSVSSFYQSSNAYESYIIGGSRTNTDNLPASSVYDALLQGAA